MRVCVVGGGTGSFAVLRGIKGALPEAHLTALVPVSDSGGSTGRLRDEFGLLPIGDARAALVALAEEEEMLMRSLFTYRFAKGSSLAGHNLGNLLLLALTELTGSEHQALEAAARILRVRGRVVPVSRQKATLVARYQSGRIVRGESLIDNPSEEALLEPIEEVWLEPKVSLHPAAQEALGQAHAIVVGPGDLYTSLIAAVLVEGAREALRACRAPLIFLSNLMTKRSETHRMGASAQVCAFARYAGRMPDIVLANATPLPSAVLERYAQEEEFPVEDDLDAIRTKGSIRIYRCDLLADGVVEPQEGDVVRRSLIRHDPQKVGKAIAAILQELGMVG